MREGLGVLQNEDQPDGDSRLRKKSQSEVLLCDRGLFGGHGAEIGAAVLARRTRDQVDRSQHARRRQCADVQLGSRQREESSIDGRRERLEDSHDPAVLRGEIHQREAHHHVRHERRHVHGNGDAARQQDEPENDDDDLVVALPVDDQPMDHVSEHQTDRH